ncbi:NAD(P)-binding protein [Paenarthrobacter sp. DKR-5]|uniref:NAD(P)-binding protein n=1 Tax=Paenarthrobacter sp. DKR-5 TaxID=2835535 RepID=UPI001BDCAF87|nr:NAD(P)-binding protein [Paenarthrobacter sp. DKR-5]MBT1004455.1 NAD(P)-binding protein [Paenarthrobacter sp. DKR-5]
MPEVPGRADLPVAVIGAGPVGLAAAAHLLEQGLRPLIFEAGDAAGASITEWGHTRLFSPWQYNIDAAARRLLEAAGWQAPRPTALPYGRELVEDYLAPLAALPVIAGALRTGARVAAVTRQGMDKTQSLGRQERPYLVRATAADGAVHDHLVRAVIDASGTWTTPNPVGSGGLAAPGEAEARGAGFISSPLPDVTGRDRHLFAGRHVLVVGAGHSAANTLLALGGLAREEPGTRISWAVRGADATRLYGGGDRDGLPARGMLGTRLRRLVDTGAVNLRTSFTITGFELTPSGAEGLHVHGATPDGATVLGVDVLIPATGFRPDLDILKEIRLDLDPGVEAPRELGPLIDPDFHSCGTVPPHGARLLAHPDRDFYIAGMKSYGRAPTFLLATGYEQVRSIAAALAGDQEAADRVQLELPETGVCSTDIGSSCDAPAAEASSCCGSSGPQPVSIGFATGSAHGRAGALATDL